VSSTPSAPLTPKPTGEEQLGFKRQNPYR
jgi:hypothetical protein